MLLVMAGAGALSAVTVVLPEKPTVQEKTAASELVLHLNKIYNTKTAIASEKNPGKDTKYIYLGNTALAAQAKIDSSKFAPEEHFIKTFDAVRFGPCQSFFKFGFVVNAFGHSADDFDFVH